MIAIIDYGVGNLFSLACSLRAVGAECEVTDSALRIRDADRVILPGVGAFGDAQKKLFSSGLAEVALERAAAGVPLMGICVGMQLLFDRSLEFGCHPGLGLIPGEVRPIAESIAPGLKIPQIGWNALHITRPHPLFKYIREGDHVYFVHSYHAVTPKEHIIADTDYGGTLTGAVAKDNVTGCQFHPEKSGQVGLSILRAFMETE